MAYTGICVYIGCPQANSDIYVTDFTLFLEVVNFELEYLLVSFELHKCCCIQRKHLLKLFEREGVLGFANLTIILGVMCRQTK